MLRPTSSWGLQVPAHSHALKALRRTACSSALGQERDTTWPLEQRYKTYTHNHLTAAFVLAWFCSHVTFFVDGARCIHLPSCYKYVYTVVPSAIILLDLYYTVHETFPTGNECPSCCARLVHVPCIRFISWVPCASLHPSYASCHLLLFIYYFISICFYFIFISFYLCLVFVFNISL